MSVVCEFCKKQCFLIEGEYICEEGHVSKFVQEMTESVDYVKRCTVIRKKAEENVYKDRDRSYTRLLMFNLIFCLLSEELNLKDEKYFQYFVNYLSGDTQKVYYHLKMDYVTMVILLYLTKREECQEKGETVYYYEFVDNIVKIDLKDRIKHFKKLLVLKWPCLDGRHTEYLVYCINLRRNILEYLTRKGHAISIVEHRLYRETGFENPFAEYNKMLFRKNLRCDLNLMLKYFKELSKLFCLQVTSEMVFYFEKFVYMRQYDKCVSIPEDEVCFYFFLYDLHKKISLNHEQAFKNVSSLSQKFQPKNKNLTNILVAYLRTSPDKFYKEVNHMLCYSGIIKQSQFFHGNYFYRRHLLKKRFYTIEIYLKKLKILLKSKKNLKIKKEYVENNMI